MEISDCAGHVSGYENIQSTEISVEDHDEISVSRNKTGIGLYRLNFRNVVGNGQQSQPRWFGVLPTTE